MSILFYVIGTIMAMVALGSALVALAGTVDTVKNWKAMRGEERAVNISALAVLVGVAIMAVFAMLFAFSAA